MKPSKIGALLAAVVGVVSMTSCQIVWDLGKTHGVITEPTAVRASVGIWRVPSQTLYDIYAGDSLETVKYLPCAAGKFPVPSLHVGSYGITANVLQPKWCGYVYGDDNDLRGALIDAQAGSANSCLALTLISSCAYIKNWTHKSIGCQQGSL